MATAIFTYNGRKTAIQCKDGDKMGDICNKYISKTGLNKNSLIFIYGGNQINYNLKFNEQANTIDKERKEMNILVYENNENELKCPKCHETLNIDNNIFENLMKLNININDMLNELKSQIDLIKNVNEIKTKIKVINHLINDIIDENNNYKKQIQNLLTFNNNEIKNSSINSNNINQIIKGTFNVEDIYKNIAIFNQLVDDDGFEVYINNEKVDIIKSYKIRYKYFKQHGKGIYEFKIIFKNNISNLTRFFEDCSDLISLNLSNFDTSNITNMELMFNDCHKLKRIDGLNQLSTCQVTNMGGLFQKCYEIEYVDLSSFDTSNVTDMDLIFNGCHKLKRIDGLNQLSTCQVTNMGGLFQGCNEIEFLDLSNFDTSNVTDFGDMFNNCHKLKYINGLNNFNTRKISIMSRMFLKCEEIENLDLCNFYNFNVTDMSKMFKGCHKLKSLNLLNFELKNNCDTEYIFDFQNKDKCKFICKDRTLKKLFYS